MQVIADEVHINDAGGRGCKKSSERSGRGEVEPEEWSQSWVLSRFPYLA